MSNAKLRLLFAGLSMVLLASAYTRLHSSAVMSEAAKQFLNSLDAGQRAKATFQFTDGERTYWHFVPFERKGLPLKEMSPAQQHLAQALLAAGLSQQGYIKAVSIMSMEDILKALEAGKKGTPVRDPERYFISIFGEPSETGTWGYRVEGHHMATNFTIVKGKVTGSPNMYGTNPALVKEGPRKGMRVLAREEDLGRDLLNALTADQKKIAIVTKTAYKDVLTGQDRKAMLENQPAGLSAAKMTAAQRVMLHKVVEEYAMNMAEDVGQARMDLAKQAGNNLNFVWAGVEERGGPHYYRVQSPKFVIEYDNTQNDANHIHAVWRDFNGDFGADLLGMHIQNDHK
jgi:hypothetical protein